MRIIAFFVTLLLGIFIASFFKPSFEQTQSKCNQSSMAKRGDYKNEPKYFSFNPQKVDTSRNYTKAEAVELVGKRVRNLTAGSAKCPKESSGDCLSLYAGEKGKVTSILPGLNETYLIEIQWDEKFADSSRRDSAGLVTRADKKFIFEIIE
jgi:hypothetical protein